MALAVAQERQGSSSSSRSGCSPKRNPKTRRESVGGSKSKTKESPLKIVSPPGSISVSITIYLLLLLMHPLI